MSEVLRTVASRLCADHLGRRVEVCTRDGVLIVDELEEVRFMWAYRSFLSAEPDRTASSVWVRLHFTAGARNEHSFDGQSGFWLDPESPVVVTL